ncbi:MAG: LysR family transcriptional regulator [Pseudomonadota bacterium]
MEDIKAIRVFLEVVDLLSFNAAARSLKMTPASVTRIVARLEEQLGQQLLLRTTRQVSLTSAGAVVAARYRPLLAAFDQTTAELLAANRPNDGHLKINAPLSMGVRLMPGLVESFRLAFPRVSLDVQLTDTLVDIIAEDCDLALRISGPPTDKSTIWRKLCVVPRVAVVSPAFLERRAELTSPEELIAADCMSYTSSGESETWTFQKGSATRAIKAGTAITSNNGDYLAGLAEAGEGICVLPDFIVHQAVQRGALVRVLPDWTLPPLWLTLFYPPYAQLPPLVATFSDFCESYLRDRDGLVFDT